MKTTFTGTIILVILMFGLNACGTKVEVPPTAVGKIISENGFKEGVISASKFRLDPCLFYCDRLVLLQTADLAKTERMELFMPRDKLVMTFDIRATLSIKPNKLLEPRLDNCLQNTRLLKSAHQERRLMQN